MKQLACVFLAYTLIASGCGSPATPEPSSSNGQTESKQPADSAAAAAEMVDSLNQATMILKTIDSKSTAEEVFPKLKMKIPGRSYLKLLNAWQKMTAAPCFLLSGIIGKASSS